MTVIETKRTALLVMDLQSEVVATFGDRLTGVLERTPGLIAAARKAGLPVIYVVVGFRPGYPELHPRNPSTPMVSQGGRFLSTTPETAVAPAVRPAAGEPIVVKHRVGAFTGTDLEVLLRSQGIETLILTGVATSGVVLSTVRHAADADYRLLVVADCCADRDDEVHRVLTEKVFPRQATVLSAHEMIAAIEGGAAGVG